MNLNPNKGVSYKGGSILKWNKPNCVLGIDNMFILFKWPIMPIICEK